MKSEKKHYVMMIIEDDESIVRLIRCSIKCFYKNIMVEIIEANNLEVAEKKFSEHHSKIDIVLVDGNLGKRGKGGEVILETLPIMEKIVEKRKNNTFKGVAIAISGDDYSNRDLLHAGCDFAFKKPCGLSSMITEEKLFTLKRKD
ncbi:MAG: hypothetical protein WAV11_02150 [Minisyncoccia bacterium]